MAMLWSQLGTQIDPTFAPLIKKVKNHNIPPRPLPETKWFSISGRCSSPKVAPAGATCHPTTSHPTTRHPATRFSIQITWHEKWPGGMRGALNSSLQHPGQHRQSLNHPGYSTSVDALSDVERNWSIWSILVNMSFLINFNKYLLIFNNID